MFQASPEVVDEVRLAIIIAIPFSKLLRAGWKDTVNLSDSFSKESQGCCYSLS